MALAERGLLATMRWYVWANDTVPSDPERLARVLGLDPEEVRAALTDRVLGFFRVSPQFPGRLYSPELHAQMEQLQERRQERSASGRKGGKASARRRVSEPAELEAKLEHPEENGKEGRRSELSKETDSFLKDMEREEERQRNGRGALRGENHR